MKPFKNKVSQTTTHNKEYKIVTNDKFDPYWDEGYDFYPRYRRGFKNSNKTIMSYQVRMYRTWKHKRKTQWKNVYHKE